MRAIIAPDDDPCVVYQICVNSVSDENLRNLLVALTNEIGIAADDYQEKVTAKKLYTLLPNNSENDDIVIRGVTKKELKEVYSRYMVGKTKPARDIYDYLLSRAPYGRCPFCGIGKTYTLDHYLPKSKYPLLSVVPINLVPSCRDCNTGKSSAVAATECTQSLHPYFDHQDFINDQWLFAEIVQTDPVAIRFYVEAPAHWDDISNKRVQTHFRDFKLASRYSDEAGDQLGCLRDVLSQYRDVLGLNGVKQHLEFEAQASSRQHKNSWQTAMFQALASSDWYCNGGFM